MKTYNFICHPNSQGFTLENPLSSMKLSTVKQAFAWAKLLMKFNTKCEQVLFKSERGRKTYTAKRDLS